jgi:hypothetical protein
MEYWFIRPEDTRHLELFGTALNSKDINYMNKIAILSTLIAISACSTIQTDIAESDLIGTWADSKNFRGQNVYTEESFLPTSMYCSMTLDLTSPGSALVLASGAWSKQGDELEISVGETWPEDRKAHMGEFRTLSGLSRTEMRYEISNILNFRSERQIDRGAYWCDLLFKLKAKP